jgi:predicted glycoside hydrolase/deacetylase ChbG (UPF0249 family)
MYEKSPLATRLGLNRAIIPHVDDLGMSHDSNVAFLKLAEIGQVTCGSVMAPCPWFPEIAEAALADPALDVGVHLTLTSEWFPYRWRPMSTVSRASGLIDSDGYMWRDVASLRAHLVPEAAETELRAQIDAVIAAGVRPTHIDAHMGAAIIPELLDLHVRLARDYQMVPVLPRSLPFVKDRQYYEAVIGSLQDQGFALPDYFHGTLPVQRSELAACWRRILSGLPMGLTHIALHATAPGEFEHISHGDHASWRFNEFDLLRRGFLTEYCASQRIRLIGYRALVQVWANPGTVL